MCEERKFSAIPSRKYLAGTTDLSLINLGWSMVLPELSFRQVGNLFSNPLPDTTSHTLIQA